MKRLTMWSSGCVAALEGGAGRNILLDGGGQYRALPGSGNPSQRSAARWTRRGDSHLAICRPRYLRRGDEPGTSDVYAGVRRSATKFAPISRIGKLFFR